MTDLPCRDAFDLPRDTAYFNAAQIGPAPRMVVAAGEAAFRARARPWEGSTLGQFFTAPEALRAQGAALFGAKAGDVALVPAASYGLAVAARNLGLCAGQEIVILDGQFPSNVYPWRALAQRTGAHIRTVHRRTGERWTDALLDAISPATGLVACGAIHWIDGGRIDLEAVSDALRPAGGALALDLTQSLGVCPFEIAAVDPDFAVAAAYKWLLCPYSIGFLYVAPRHQAGEPLEENWINREGSEDFSRLIDYRDRYAEGARRFDVGERSSHQLVPAARAALDFLSGFGIDAVATRLSAVSAEIAERLAPLGFLDDTPDRAGHYLALRMPDHAPSDLVERLRLRDVHVSRRGDRLRISPHVHVDTTDIDRLVTTLAELCRP